MICGDKNYSLEQPDTCPACGYPQGKALRLVLCINYISSLLKNQSV